MFVERILFLYCFNIDNIVSLKNLLALGFQVGWGILIYCDSSVVILSF